MKLHEIQQAPRCSTKPASGRVHRWLRVLGPILICAVSVLAAPSCNQGTDTGNPFSPDDYLSDNPLGTSPGGGTVRVVDATTEQATGTEGVVVPTSEGVTDPERSIAEADLIQIDGDLLYALAPGWLSIIDLATSGQLTVLGRLALPGVPREMYLSGGYLWVVSSGGLDTEVNEETMLARYEPTTHLLVVDVGDPAAPRLAGDTTITGDLEDTRRVGDVLYAVTTANGECWGCSVEDPWIPQNLPASTAPWPYSIARGTVVTALDVSDPASPSLVDQLRFPDRRVVSVAEERLYLAVLEVDSFSSPLNPSVQVVDISDPNGAMQPGAEVPIAGGVRNRWQMDEREGVLRVITQGPGTGAVAPAPMVQTFQVVSASELTLLGEAALPIPPSERLLSVRYDGARAFAITAFVQPQVIEGDPLYTIDLSDPANPMVLGELEMPGWVYHLEPMGDRLLGIGYDEGHAEHRIHASLFDVSDLTQPSMLQRVNFGGRSSFPETQGKIDRALEVDAEAGLILLPLTSGVSPNAPDGSVQLLQFDTESLTLRASLGTLAAARRAFLHAGEAVTISDKRAQRFDVSDLDQPIELARERLIQAASLVKLSDTSLFRSVQIDEQEADASFESPYVVETVPVDDPNAFAGTRLPPPEPGSGPPDWPTTAQAIGSLALSHGQYSYSIAVTSPKYGVSTAIQTTPAAIPNSDGAPDPSQDPSTESVPVELGAWLFVVDESDPLVPKYFEPIKIPFEWIYFDLPGVTWYPERAVIVGESLVLLNAEYVWEGDVFVARHPYYTVFSLADPASPTLVGHYHPTPSEALTGLIRAGDRVLSSRFIRDENSGRLRIYVDRLDLSDPREPRLLEPISVPGLLVDYDAEVQQLLTLNYHLAPVAGDGILTPESVAPDNTIIYAGEQILERSESLSLLKLSGSHAEEVLNLPIDGRRIALATSAGRLVVSVAHSPSALFMWGQLPSLVEFQVFEVGDGTLTPRGSVSERHKDWGHRIDAFGQYFSITGGVLLDTTSLDNPALLRPEGYPGFVNTCAHAGVVGQRFLVQCTTAVGGSTTWSWLEP